MTPAHEAWHSLLALTARETTRPLRSRCIRPAWRPVHRCGCGTGSAGRQTAHSPPLPAPPRAAGPPPGPVRTDGRQAPLQREHRCGWQRQAESCHGSRSHPGTAHAHPMITFKNPESRIWLQNMRMHGASHVLCWRLMQPRACAFFFTIACTISEQGARQLISVHS